jgi:hypothetical protein
MTWKLTITRAALAALTDGLRANPARVQVCPAGLSRLPDSTELLLHSVGPSASNWNLPARVVVLGAANELDLNARLQQALARPVADSPAVFLALDANSGRVAGFAHSSTGTFEPLDEFTVVAEGFPRVIFSPTGNAPLSTSEAQIWSRTIGALGETVWRRLTELRYCLVGCGRTGSLVASSLGRFGAKHLTLIDPDRWEMHNLGESADIIGPDSVGQAKAALLADVLGDSLAVPREGAVVRALNESVLSLPALLAAKAADVFICAADNPTAHLATAVLAKLYLKPLLDIGTGVLVAPGGEQRMGADVRLVLPDRCLVCFGGVSGFAEARRELLEGSAVGATPIESRRERLGSLRSLNMVATGHALRLLEELAAGRIRASAWLNLEFEPDGLPRLNLPVSAAPSRCSACSFTGHGDSGITRLAEMLRT